MQATNPSFLSRLNHSMTRFFVRHKSYTAFLFVMVTAVVFYGLFSTPKIDRESYTVTRVPVKQYVKVSGQVKTSKDASLSFQTTGQVSYVGVKIGDKVKQGTVLATLSGADAQASLLQAQGVLANAQATLSQLQQGARPEEIAIKEQSLQNTQSSLTQSYSALPDTIQNVDAVTADIVKNKFAPLFAFSGSRYTLSFSSCDQRLQGAIEIKRNALETTLASFQTKSSVITAISSVQSIDSTFEQAYQAALSTNDLVNALSNLLLSPCSVGNSNLDGYRVTLSVVKTTMTTLFSDITTKRTTLITSKNAFNQASRDFDLTKAGTDPYRVQAQTALVSQAQAQVNAAQSGLTKTIIRAPFSGVVSDVTISLGETNTSGQTAVTMLATDGFEVEAKVPEIDIVKVKLGADVDITLDAYGKDVVFPAIITRINPGATTEGTVPVYKVTVTFNGNDSRIKQGMTANVNIVTENKENVIAVPARFVKIINGTEGIVEVLIQGKSTVKQVQYGIRGADGLLEIKSGIIIGDSILAPLTATRQSQKQNK